MEREWPTDALWLVSPVSLIPIHQLVKVSFWGWGMTVDANSTHWVTWLTNGIVKSWCRGSLKIGIVIRSYVVRGVVITSSTYKSPSMSEPANAKFQSCLGQLKGLPWKHPVRNSSFCEIRSSFWECDATVVISSPNWNLLSLSDSD
jgi:hypothetical protein